MCDFQMNVPTICEDLEGRYQYYLDCLRYYKCYQLGEPPTLIRCSPGKYFSTITNECEKGECC